ncbi:NADH-quinone oxidoreductase subunit C [soil metagenome]
MVVDIPKLHEVVKNKLGEYFGEKIFSTEVSHGELSIVVDRDVIVPVCEKLRDDPDFQFNFCSYATAIDWSQLGRTPRFEMIYQLLSLTKGHRMRVKAGVPEDDPTIETVSGVWAVADWLERETYDMFGIIFKNHPDLRRILMPEDWEGYPLRKEFPLGGVKSFYFKRSTDPRAGEPKTLVPRIREQLGDI